MICTPIRQGHSAAGIEGSLLIPTLSRKDETMPLPTANSYRGDMIKGRISETDKKTVGRTIACLGRLLYPATRLPGEKCGHREADKKDYPDTVFCPLINSLQLIWDFAPRPSGLSIGIMVGRVIRRRDIIPMWRIRRKRCACQSMISIYILWWRRVEDSLLGDPPHSFQNLVSHS